MAPHHSPVGALARPSGPFAAVSADNGWVCRKKGSSDGSGRRRGTAGRSLAQEFERCSRHNGLPFPRQPSTTGVPGVQFWSLVRARAFSAADWTCSHNFLLGELYQPTRNFDPFASSCLGIIVVRTYHQHADSKRGLTGSDALVPSASLPASEYQLVCGRRATRDLKTKRGSSVASTQNSRRSQFHLVSDITLLRHSVRTR